MHFETSKIIGSIIGAIISFKIIFWLFSPSELWTIIFIFAFIFLAYGIQPTEWVEEKSFSLFEIDIYSSRKVCQQYRIFGLIPITEKKYVETHYSLFEDLEAPILLVSKTAISTIPFGALSSKVGK